MRNCCLLRRGTSWIHLPNWGAGPLTVTESAQEMGNTKITVWSLYPLEILTPALPLKKMMEVIAGFQRPSLFACQRVPAQRMTSLKQDSRQRHNDACALQWLLGDLRPPSYFLDLSILMHGDVIGGLSWKINGPVFCSVISAYWRGADGVTLCGDGVTRLGRSRVK